MLGFECSYAAFHIVETMSSPKIAQKRIGYLAAAQTFYVDTDVMMLTPNLVKKVGYDVHTPILIALKDLASSNYREVLLALESFPEFFSPAMVADIASEVLRLLGHSNIQIRKKAVLICSRIMRQHEDLLPGNLETIENLLHHSDWSVISATVNTVCELSKVLPEECLILAPSLFKLLTDERCSNWTLIKLIKLFASLVPYENRLIRKLTLPLTEVINSSTATSVVFECAHNIFAGNIMIMDDSVSEHLALTCLAKLGDFLTDDDQNLRYVALASLSNIGPTYSKYVANQKEAIFGCLKDSDLSIRTRALDLAVNLVDEDTLMPVVKELVIQLLPNSSYVTSAFFVSNTIPKIISMARRNNYENVSNFNWYFAILLDLARIPNPKADDTLIASEIQSIVSRVQPLQSFAIKLLMDVLEDNAFVSSLRGNAGHVWTAITWIIGEYCTLIPNPPRYLSLLRETSVGYCHVSLANSVSISSASKVLFLAVLLPSVDTTGILTLTNAVNVSLNDVSEISKQLLNSKDLESRLRAESLYALLDKLKNLLDARTNPTASQIDSREADSDILLLVKDVCSLFTAYQLNPVSARAQGNLERPQWLSDTSRSTILSNCRPLPHYNESARSGTNNTIQVEGLRNDLPSSFPISDVDAIPIVKLDDINHPSFEIAKATKAKEKRKTRRKKKAASAKLDKTLRQTFVAKDEDVGPPETEVHDQKLVKLGSTLSEIYPKEDPSEDEKIRQQIAALQQQSTSISASQPEVEIVNIKKVSAKVHLI